MLMVRFLLAYLAFLLLCAAPLPAQSQKYEGQTIRNIQFNPREQPLDPSELHDILPLQMNQPFRMKDLRATIDRLFATGRYADIQVDAQPYRDGVAIEFITKSSWFIGDISIAGKINSPPNIGQIENATDLGLGQPYTDVKLEEAVEGVKRLLENNGLFRSEIRPVFDWETDKDHQQVNIRFEVDSGNRSRFTAPQLTGDLKADQKVIQSKMKLQRWIIRTWKPMTQSRVRQAVDGVRSYYQGADRLQAKVTLEGVHYDAAANRASPALHIDAGPKIEIRTVGAKVSRSVLKRHVPVFEEHAVDQDLLVEGARNLRDYFQGRGFFEAEVEFKPQAVLNDKATIDFLINPGKQHRLVYIEIQGNKYFKTPDIRERMFLQTSSFLQFPHGRYSGNLLKRDEDAVRSLYQSNGFRDVKVTPEVKDNYLGKEGNIGVLITIVEGPQYFVHDLMIDGIEHLEKDQIIASLSSVKGQPFSEFNVSVDRDTILARYFEGGFPDATFEWKPLPTNEPNQIDLKFTIKEGRQQFVRAVLVSGNKYTKNRLINRTITLSPGDPLSPTEMTDIQRRLYNLGVFAKVETAIQNPDGQTDRKYALFHLDEARRYSAAVGVGAELGKIGGCRTCYSAPAGATAFSPRVSFDITRNNLWGIGHNISLRTRLSTLDERALLNYSWPRFASNDSLSAQITGMYELSRSVRTFSYKRQEGSVQLVQKLNKARTIFYRLTYRRVGLSDLRVTPFIVPQLARPIHIGIPSVNLIEDKRDDAIDPHKGIYTTVDLGVADHIFGSQVNFARALVHNSTYHPLTKRLVLARSTQFGDIYGFHYRPGDAHEIPLAERFYGGGGTSHRGFAENQAGSRELTTGFPTGGTALFFNQTELRFPLLGDNIGGVLFHDMGNIYSSLKNISFRSSQRDPKDFDYLVHGVGFGIRYRTPVGPVRLDLGYALNPPSFFGFDPNATLDELIAAGPNPCSPPAGVTNRCQLQSVGHFRFFFSIGQTF